MEQSILKSTKKTLGIAPEDDAFDLDILIHINSVMADLHQLGLPSFAIEDDSDVWADYIGTTPRFNNVKTYMYFRLRNIWDPPKTSFEISAINEQRKELEWRIAVEVDRTDWADPNPIIPDGLVLDGGTP